MGPELVAELAGRRGGRGVPRELSPKPYRWQDTPVEVFKMVYYFVSNVVDPPVTLFMGRDKHENEDLIRWGWPEDVWFHVDKLSSAHVYLRLAEGQTIEDIPKVVVEEAAQLVKHNSIKGDKMNDIDVVYTMWSNLHKTDGMEGGQVGFHSQNKTKVEKENVDFRSQREERDSKERQAKKKAFKAMEEQKKIEEEKRKAEAELRSYDRLMTTDNMSSNKDGGNDSDDFM